MIEAISAPDRDWLPVFLPVLYEFGFSLDTHSDFETPTLSDSGGKVKLNWPVGSDEPGSLPYTGYQFADTAGEYAGITAVADFVEFNLTTGTTVILDLPYTGPEPAPDGVLITGPLTAPVLAVKIEVSSNATDFSSPIVAGVAYLPANAAGEYAFNPHAYLASTFEPYPPVLTGPDYSLFKYYRLLVGPVNTFNGTTGTPAIVTTPSRVLYASELTPLGVSSTTLSISPFTANTSLLPSVKTVIASNVVSNIPQPLEVSAPCPQYPIHLYWLNRKGGWNAYVFNGKHEYQEEIPDAVFFEDFLGYQHKAEIKPVRNSVSVFSGFIPGAAYDMVKTIRSAIRVYQATQSGLETVFREVNIKGGSFPVKKEGNRLYECNFAFTYAEPVIIQTA